LTAFTGEPFGIVAANYGDDSITGTEVVHGEQGDDEIWGGSKTSDTQHLHGGSGDDSVYVGYKAAGKAYAYGNSGKDIVRSDWFSQYDEDIFAAGNEYLFGDFKYGTDNLDKDLWGDDDIIYGGNDEGSYNGYRYGGDGDDIIWTGDGWKESKSYGGNDDDTFHLGQLNTAIKTYGGDGDDTWVRTQDYGEVTDETSANTGVEYARGGAGNDVVRGTHLNTGNQFLFGGDGEDMLYGGDGVAAYGNISGGDGDDWIQGGDNAAGNQYLHGDSTDFTNEWGFTTEVTGETNYGEGNDRF